MPPAFGSSSKLAGWLCLLLCANSSIQGCVGQRKEDKVAWLVPEGGSQAAVPAGAATFAKAEEFLTAKHLAVYDTLMMTADYSITAEAWGQKRFSLQRNLTIASPPGFVFNLEFDFITQGLAVPKGITVTLRSIALGKVRDTAGWSLPFFTGDGGTMILLSVVRTRLACLPVAPTLPATLTATPRPAGLPGKQRVSILDYYWRGHVYPGSFHSSDLALTLGPGDVDDMQSFKGYNMLQINVTRVCLSYVPKDCTDPPDICLKRATQAMLYGNSRARGSSGELTPQALLAAIVVPVVAAAVVLAAVTGLLLLRRRKQQGKQLPILQHDKQQKQQQRELLLAEASSGKLPPSPTSLQRHQLRQQQQQQQVACARSVTSSHRGEGAAAAGGSGGWGSGPAAERLANICSGASGTIEDVATGPAGAGSADCSSGWRLMACHNAPEFRDATPKDRITLGLLLGVGSFGRVYKGSWRGMEVAVKVLHHDSNTAAAVANEVDLVMSFKHPNITTAFHFVTWNYENTAADATTPAAAVNSAGCPPEKMKQQAHSSTLQDQSMQRDSEQGEAAAAAAGAAAGHATSSTSSAGATALLKRNCNPAAAAAAAAALPTLVEQPSRTSVDSASQQQVVVPIGALSRAACSNGSSSSSAGMSNAIAAGHSPAAAAAADRPAILQPAAAAAAAAGLDHAETALPAAAAATAAGGSWSSTADCPHSSSISNTGSFYIQPEFNTPPPAAAAAAPDAVVSATTDSQPVQLWPANPHGQHQRQFVVLTPLHIERIPDLQLPHQQQQQQQQLSNPVPQQTSTECNNSAGRSGAAARRAAPCEAQTWLVMEYCNGGTLLDVLQEGRLVNSRTGKVNMAHVLTLLCDVAAGMSYLHSRNVLHGDLKPGNVLLAQRQGAPWGHVAKVTDFGMSRCLGVGQSHRSTRTLGTVNHTSPELLRLGRLSPAGDIYAFGVLMWECYTGRVAWAGLHYGEVFERVALMQQRPPLPPGMPADYAALLAAAWSPDPFVRPSFESIRAQLAAMLAGLVQEQDGAAERFVCDLV